MVASGYCFAAIRSFILAFHAFHTDDMPGYRQSLSQMKADIERCLNTDPSVNSLKTASRCIDELSAVVENSKNYSGVCGDLGLPSLKDKLDAKANELQKQTETNKTA